MSIYIVDGLKVRAASAKDLVRFMHTMSRSQAADDQAWMEDASERTILQSGGKLRTSSEEEFVEDMLAAGLIVLEEK